MVSGSGDSETSSAELFFFVLPSLEGLDFFTSTTTNEKEQTYWTTYTNYIPEEGNTFISDKKIMSNLNIMYIIVRLCISYNNND